MPDMHEFSAHHTSYGLMDCPSTEGRNASYPLPLPFTLYPYCDYKLTFHLIYILILVKELVVGGVLMHIFIVQLKL